MADDALAYLVEAFGHVSEAEIEAFLDASAVSDASAPAEFPFLPKALGAELDAATA